MKNKLVGLREFQQKLHANLPEKEEQVVLTKRGEPVYVVANLGSTTFTGGDYTFSASTASLPTPRGKIAFDVDDTLLVPSVATGLPQDTPNYETVNLFKWFQAQGYDMVIWSGSGLDWAKRWAEKLGLDAEIRVKEKSDDVDIAFDDCDVDLGKVNIKVKRINNKVSRHEWNATKGGE